MVKRNRNDHSFTSPGPRVNKLVKFDDIENQISMAQLQLDSTAGTPKKTKFRMPDTPDPRQKTRRESLLKKVVNESNGESDVEVLGRAIDFDDSPTEDTNGTSTKVAIGTSANVANGTSSNVANGSLAKKKKKQKKTKRAAKPTAPASSSSSSSSSTEVIFVDKEAIQSESHESVIGRRSKRSGQNVVTSEDEERDLKPKQVLSNGDADADNSIDDANYEDESESMDYDDDEQEGIELGSCDTSDADGETGQLDDDDDSFVVADDEEFEHEDDESSEDDDDYLEDDDEEDEEDMVVSDVPASELVELADEQLDHDTYNEPNEPESVLDVAEAFDQRGYKSIVLDEFCLALQASLARRVSMPYEPFIFADGFDDDSTACALKALTWMISPCEVPLFFRMFYQRSAFVVKRGLPHYYGELFTTARFLKLLQTNTLEYGRNVNAALYVDGVRTTPNGEGRVTPAAIRDHLRRGHSIQCVNPQAYDKNLHYISEILQEAFSCFVGANSYITPAGSKGFAPHWDDVDAFVLQLEGRKHWTISAPLDVEDKLPTESSGNFNDSILDAPNRRVVFDDFLEEGDLLYIPRGFVHRAYTTSKHSLHVTISVARKFAYSDFMKKAIDQMLDKVTADHLLWRQGLPPMFFNVAGVAGVDYSSSHLSQSIQNRICGKMIPQLVESIANFSDSVLDNMVLDFMRVALPPLLSAEELKFSALDTGDQNVYDGYKEEYGPTTKVRLIRRHAQRLIYSDENTAFIAHRMSNPMFYNEMRDPTTFDFPIELEAGFNKLCSVYPNWTTLHDLNLTMLKARRLTRLLYKHCLLLVDNSPPAHPTADQTSHKQKDKKLKKKQQRGNKKSKKIAK